MDTGDLHLRDAWEIADLVRAGRLTATEVLDTVLHRIGRHDAEINSLAAVDPDAARAAAERIDATVAAGEDPGPLAGVPIGVKDLENASGFVTSYGSLLFKDNLVESDSTQVARLRAAGAVVVGKTTTPELGSIAYTSSKIHGVTRNPWNLERTPGGSSGGSAAAVSAGIVPLATASDGGGSIRIPASYCGLPGLKPTFGLIPRGPGRTGASNLGVYGPMTRSVRDIGRYLDVTAGSHPMDPLSLPRHPDGYEAGLELPPKSATAVYSENLGFGDRADEVGAIARAGAEKLFALCGIEEEKVPVNLPDVGSSWAIAETIDCYADLDAFWPDRSAEMTPVIALAMQIAASLTPDQLADATRDRFEVLARVNTIFEKVDLLLTPTTPTVAFDADGPMPTEMDGRFLSNPLIALCFTYPLNLTGHPAITIPVGISAEGLPVGLQVVGPRMSEHELLRIAAAYEREHPWRKVAPGYD